MKKVLLSFTALFIAVGLTACSASDSLLNRKEETPPEEENSGTAAPSDYVFDDVEGDMADETEAAVSTFFAGEGKDSADGMLLESDAYAPSDDYYGISDFESNVIPAAAGTLTAGEWIDNDHITFWNALYQLDETGWNDFSSLWNRNYTVRTFVTVTLNGAPVENASVTISGADGEHLWSAKTDNEGKAYLFYPPSYLDGEMSITVSYKNLGYTSEFNTEKFDAIELQLAPPEDPDEFPAESERALDFMLVVDTTGSMSDELEYLKEELESVINRAVSDNGNIPVRLSVNFYRDDGDEYVVRDFEFTENISEAISDLRDQSADGGGDEPEKVNSALDNAINEHDWSDDSTKLLFIILDAPPHSDDSRAVAEMNELNAQAAEKGIRIIPVLASGGNKEAEYLMRDMAMKTGGTYLFLTDDSGVSVGGHIQPTVGDYEVEKLNDLMVKVIDRYLADLSVPASYIDEQVDITEIPDETTTAYEQDPYTIDDHGITID